MTTTRSVVWVLVMVLGFAAFEARAQHSEHSTLGGTPLEQLGDVDFPVSCSPAAQKDFNRAMALFHSFWFDSAKESFAKVLKRDPNRFRGIYGAARAAETSGNRKAARDYYARLQTLAVGRDTERPELAQARAFLKRR